MKLFTTVCGSNSIYLVHMPTHMSSIALYYVTQSHFAEFIMDTYFCKNIIAQTTQYFRHCASKQFKEL